MVLQASLWFLYLDVVYCFFQCVLLINYFWFLNLFIRKTLQTSRIKAQGICSKTIHPSLGYGSLGRVYPGLSLRKTTSGRNLLRESAHQYPLFRPFLACFLLKSVLEDHYNGDKQVGRWGPCLPRKGLVCIWTKTKYIWLMIKNSGCDYIFEVEIVENYDNRFIYYSSEYVIKWSKDKVLLDRLIGGKYKLINLN